VQAQPFDSPQLCVLRSRSQLKFVDVCIPTRYEKRQAKSRDTWQKGFQNIHVPEMLRWFMNLPGTNLLGANQWQTFQLQDAAKTQNQPVPKMVSVDLQAIHQQSATAGSVVPSGSQAVKLDLPPGRLDSQDRDKSPHDFEGETGASAEDESPGDREGNPSRQDFLDQEELTAFVLKSDRKDWMRWLEDAEFTASTRHLLGDLLASGTGIAARYVRESLQVGSNFSLVHRCLDGSLAAFARGDSERGAKLLAILMTGFVKIGFLEDFFGLALVGTADESERPLHCERLRQLLDQLRQVD
jgi:hypothetical protein